MDNNICFAMNEYNLVLLQECHITTLYRWVKEEQHMEYFTCRPVPSYESYEAYAATMLAKSTAGIKKIYLLVNKNDIITPLGRITLFDINPRNQSAEFGYYMPESLRGKGLGSVMLSKFLTVVFHDQVLNLNKVYATTSAGNLLSMKLLEKQGFHLDGRNREHYWIEGHRYDQMVYSLLRREWEERSEKKNLSLDKLPPDKLSYLLHT